MSHFIVSECLTARKLCIPKGLYSAILKGVMEEQMLESLLFSVVFASFLMKSGMFDRKVNYWQP